MEMGRACFSTPYDLFRDPKANSVRDMYISETALARFHEQYTLDKVKNIGELGIVKVELR
jgi:hypothetical protein